MAWQIAITLAAIGAVVLFHSAVAKDKPAGAPPPAPAKPPRNRDPWARVLVVAACAAGLLAVGVIAVPAVSGNDEAASTTSPSTTAPTTTVPPTSTTAPTTTVPPTTTTTPTTTVPPTSTSTSTSTSTTTKTTTIHLTTTNPTTTPPTSPPPGSVLLVRANVKPDGSVSEEVNRLGQDIVVRRTATGQYRIRFPGLSDESRRRSTVSVSAGTSTAAVAGWAPNGTLVVLLFDRKSGEPVSRNFTFAVSAPKLPATR